MSNISRIAIVSETFWGDGGADRLRSRLREAVDAGAELAILPELPFDPWVAAREEASADDAEELGGRRSSMCSMAAARASIGVVGGAILVEPQTGQRHNNALAYDVDGRLVHRYRKVHLPQEEGFWEASHYRPGRELAHSFVLGSLRLGLQLCSDVNRPTGCQILGAERVDLIAAPRATPVETYVRWRTVLGAAAITSGCYLVSVNRPSEPGAMLGGPSVAFSPEGEVLVETLEPLAFFEVDRGLAAEARGRYPGYLDIPAAVYADAWRQVALRGESDR